MSKRGGFFVRLCYGYVGRYKDTSKMTAKEVIEEFLKSKGVASPREYFRKRFRRRIFRNPRLPDEILPRSVGAKWSNYEIKMPDGSTAKFVEGKSIQNKHPFAGYGTRVPIRDIERLNRQYNVNSIKWQKVKAEAYVETMGEEIYCEIHWYEEETIGKVEFKFKREL